MEASSAYDNIIGAIKAAEEAANQAGKAADSALSVSDQISQICYNPSFIFFNYGRGPEIKHWCVLASFIFLWPFIWLDVLHVDQLVFAQH